MTGVDVVYKDVVEPLESVSVTITPTDKKDITEFGDIADVSGCCCCCCCVCAVVPAAHSSSG